MTDTSLTDEQEFILCYDLGGTFLRCAVFDRLSNELIAQQERLIPNYLILSQKIAKDILNQVIKECESVAKELIGDLHPKIIVIGYPGPITPNGIALRSPTILNKKIDEPFNITKAFSAIFPDTIIYVVNDLVCSGYFFVKQGYQDFCILTVGSGIGNKVFINKKPVLGTKGRGGEIGHLKVLDLDELPFEFSCIDIGDISSGRGTSLLAIAWAKERPEDFNESSMKIDEFQILSNDIGFALAKAYREKDKLALKIVTIACKPLSYGIASIHQAIGIEKFFIIGGFSKALGEGYRKTLIDLVSDMTWDLNQDWDSMIELGSLEKEEGLLGSIEFLKFI